MRVVRAPELYLASTPGKTLFMAGGITGCPPWQSMLLARLGVTNNLIVFDPRQASFDVKNPEAASSQVAWEYHHFRHADAISFWFPEETLCPIVLFELGAWSFDMENKIFVGMHPNYPRRLDVELQMALHRPGLEIVYDLDNLAEQIVAWAIE